MNTKRNKIIYYSATGILSAFMMISILMYTFAHEVAIEAFTNLGFPTYIIYPLAIAKLLGLIAIWTGKSKLLKEWAYAGFFFNFLLAISAHINVGDGEYIPVIVGIILLITSYVFSKKMVHN
jgi:hypothetical protein